MYVHPCEEVTGIYIQNQISKIFLYIDALYLICVKRSIGEVKKYQISKHGYRQGPVRKPLKTARC